MLYVKKIQLILNPIAGNGRSRVIGDEVCRRLKSSGIPYEMTCTACAGHAVSLAAQAAERGADSVLSIGGDGTALETATGLRSTSAALGIIPAGTGNDFIKTLGYPSDPMAALEHVMNHAPVPTDVGLLNDTMFLNETGTGFDVKVLEYAEKAKKYCRGLLPYLYGVIGTIVHYRPTLLTYQIDEEPAVTENVLVCAVANGGIIGGGIPIAPKARVDDGLFDVVIVRDVPKRRLPLYLPRLMAGKILSFPETLYRRARKVVFSAPDMKVNIDGEIRPMAQVSLEIGSGQLLVHR